MGTDIHLEVEVLGEDGVWHWVEHPERDCDYDLCDNGVYSEETPNKDMVGKPCYNCRGTGRYVGQFWNDRNYDVFAILADVRNGVGFAGIDTGDGFVPISQPKGFPVDLSDVLKREVALYDGAIEDGDWEAREKLREELFGDWKRQPNLGDHSFSWLTVAEILNYDWDRTTKKRGWVDAWNFELWRRNGRPDGWSGGVSGGMIEHVSNAHMAHMIDSGEIQWTGPEPERHGWNERPYTTPLQRTMQEMGAFPEGSHGESMAKQGTRYYTNVEWEVPYLDSAKRFLDVVQRDIAPLGPSEKVRLVFGFDS